MWGGSAAVKVVGISESDWDQEWIFSSKIRMSSSGIVHSQDLM